MLKHRTETPALVEQQNSGVMLTRLLIFADYVHFNHDACICQACVRLG
jgi:hypothetical protein